jgi:hypothetical protein
MSFRKAVFCLISVGCWSNAVLAQVSVSITAASVRPHIVKLADDKLEGRGAGYRGEKMAADHIAAEFKRIGLRTGVGKSYFQEFRFHSYHPTKPWQVMTSRNVLGVLDGADPALKKEVVVIGAHYDGQGMAGQADPTRFAAPAGSPVDNIWNSANDNAASVAAIIEIARALKNAQQRPKRTILFALFGAEEHGMTGSIHYVNNPVFPVADHVAMINLEKLGRAPERPFTVMGTMSSKAWPELVSGAVGSSGTKIAPSPMAFPDSDHYPFGSRGVPAIMIMVNAPAHNPDDHADTINFERVAEGTRYALELLRAVSDRPQRPDFVRSPMLDPGLIAHLVTPAEAEAAKLEAGKGGLKVTGVIAGLPADKAGFKEGDVIMAMGTRTFAREEPLSVLMAGFQDLLQGKLGVSIPMKVIRGGKPMDVTLNLRP